MNSLKSIILIITAIFLSSLFAYKLYLNWQDRQVTILYTGDVLGELEPCG